MQAKQQTRRKQAVNNMMGPRGTGLGDCAAAIRGGIIGCALAGWG